MKRRDFSLACSAVFAGSALVQTNAQAQANTPPVAGTDYLVVQKRAPVEAPAGKVEVVEFFWYGCSHCNKFEPTFNEWTKRVAKDVAVKRVPVAFQDSFVPQQRLFYALEEMDLLDKLHSKIFMAVHVERKDLSKPDLIVDWVVKQGVDKAKFQEHFNSFGVSTKASRATQLQNAYKVEGVPALGVAGRFYTDGSLTGGMPRSLAVVDSLIVQVRAGR